MTTKTQEKIVYGRIQKYRESLVYDINTDPHRAEYSDLASFYIRGVEDARNGRPMFCPPGPCAILEEYVKGYYFILRQRGFKPN